MTENQYKVVQDNLGEYSVLRPDNSIVCTELQYKVTAELFCDELNELNNENEQLKRADNLCECETEIMKLKEQLKDCHQKKQNIKDFLMNSEPVLEQKKLQKLIYRTIINLIDEKIKEADECFEQTYDSWYQGQIDALKELKKELKE